ncbi:MerR family transcriptional regulator [Massilia sp. CFBP9012]|uniref:MerR family transcriptional regulator n=1 Tax=Massilia sp. CFBP9012 TaxID=3096531 RepID=UPI002A698EF6|nr:MerR family transcriptional regulator [Massilia sp. CFBP9012]MDY0977418.1 MerR family transcriptional regulator [Massilia sp. CFBP9012]
MQSDSSPAALSIGELARQTGASVRSLRHYDQQGLLDARRAANGYRVFPPGAVTRVRQIQRLIAAGFTLAEIRGFPNCMLAVEGAAMCAETAPTQHKLLAAIEAEMGELERRRARLRAMLAGTAAD